VTDRRACRCAEAPNCVHDSVPEQRLAEAMFGTMNHAVTDPVEREQHNDRVEAAMQRAHAKIEEAIEQGKVDRADTAHAHRAPEPEYEQPVTVRPSEFAQVVDELRAQYRPGVPDDELPPAPQVTYLAGCATCLRADERTAAGALAAVPFGDRDDRDRWAHTHAQSRKHIVTLAEQRPGHGAGTGTTVTGAVHPRPGEPAPLPPALVAFVLREGAEPDLLCRVPERAGATWLMTAAYACLLGRASGSLGIERAHRVMYVGRLNLAGADDELFDVRIDAVMGATGPEYGAAIGRQYRIAVTLDPASAEQVVEELITRDTGLTRNLFGVILVADAPATEPADEHADTHLRTERAAGRASVPGALLGVPAPAPAAALGPPDIGQHHRLDSEHVE